MPGKSLEQRMADTETRIRQLEAQKRILAQQVKTQQRKERTRQLIQIGGIMARLGIDTVEKAQALQRIAEAQPEIRTWLAQSTTRTPNRQMSNNGTDRVWQHRDSVDGEASRL